MAQCQASCGGSCTAEANVDCQVSCQTSGSASCEASLMGGCTAQCSAPMGALFCDGQYVDVGGDIESCLTDLKNLLNITVTASGSANCSGDQCTAMGQASASCAASPEGGAPLSGGFAIVGLGAIGAAVARRRARKHTA
jgi:MYXO-CTERM domain-containing protein